MKYLIIKLIFFRVFLVGVYSCSYSFPSILRASRQMTFRITTKNVFQFTWRRRTVDSAKEKLKGKFLKNIEHDLFTRGQMAPYMNSYRWLNRRQMENNVFLFWLCYKRNGKRCSCATMESWMHLGGLQSTQEARVALGYRLVRLLRFFRA